MNTRMKACHIFEGTGDDLMAQQAEGGSRIILVPDAPAFQRDPAGGRHVRIMWGQRLIDDLVDGRYRTLVCAVNSEDNTHGFITLLSQRLPTSQWREPMITDYAKHFVQRDRVTVVKYDMDGVEVLGILRPSNHDHLTVEDLSSGFQTACAMLDCRPDRYPVASVCFLGARANKLVDSNGDEPSLETVLQVMYNAGYRGDVYPAPWMWETAPTPVFPRYPFPETFNLVRQGGY